MPNISDLPAFLYTLISEENALVITEFPDWVELWVNLLYLNTLRLRGIMTGRHFHANIKVQTGLSWVYQQTNEGSDIWIDKDRITDF